MKLICKIFLFFLNVLNLWLFKIPSRFSVIALLGYNLLIYFTFGRWSIDAVEQILGRDSYKMALFHIFISFPMFYSFICCWSASKMASSEFRKSNTDAIDRAIEYRNRQVGVQTPQQAFETMKKTAVLDQIKSNIGIDVYDKALTGFNADFGNKTPQEIFNKLSSNNR